MMLAFSWEFIGNLTAILTAFGGAVVAVTITRAKLDDLRSRINEMSQRIGNMEQDGSSKTRENYAILASSLASHDVRITKLEAIIPQLATVATDVSWIKREMERVQKERQ